MSERALIALTLTLKKMDEQAKRDLTTAPHEISTACWDQ